MAEASDGLFGDLKTTLPADAQSTCSLVNSYREARRTSRGGDGWEAAHMEHMVELARLRGLERLFGLKRALEACGIETGVWHDGTAGIGRYRGLRQELRLMVSERDVVRARWILHGAGLDTWPAASVERERSETMSPGDPSSEQEVA
jgi:hypothetical protein